MKVYVFKIVITVFFLGTYVYSSDNMTLSEENLKNINHEQFSSPRVKIKETPSMLDHSYSFGQQKEIAFEELNKKDVYELSQELTNSYLDQQSQDVAEEDFILKDSKIKVESKEKTIKFSRTPL